MVKFSALWGYVERGFIQSKGFALFTGMIAFATSYDADRLTQAQISTYVPNFHFMGNDFQLMRQTTPMWRSPPSSHRAWMLPRARVCDLRGWDWHAPKRDHSPDADTRSRFSFSPRQFSPYPRQFSLCLRTDISVGSQTKWKFFNVIMGLPASFVADIVKIFADYLKFPYQNRGLIENFRHWSQIQVQNLLRPWDRAILTDGLTLYGWPLKLILCNKRSNGAPRVVKLGKQNEWATFGVSRYTVLTSAPDPMIFN